MSEPLPDLLARIAAAAGEEAALLVAKAFGGRPFYLPNAEEITPSHRLAEVVGVERARAICNEIGRGEVTFPRGPFSSVAETRRRVSELLDQERSHGAIARELNLHIRTVEKISAKLRHKNRRQGSLF